MALSMLSPAALRAAGIFLHRWLGLVVGVVFVVAGLTGSLLTYAPELTGELFPALDGPPPEDWRAYRADVLARVERERDDVALIRFPNEHQGVYELYLDNDALEYRDAINGNPVLEREPLADILAFSRELHTHLFLGHEGEELLGWLGIAMLVLLATGIWLWWPRPGLWRFTFKRPRSGGIGPQLFWWHKTIGVASVLALFFVTLTGVGMVFYTPAQTVLTALFGGEPPVVPGKSAIASKPIDWPVVVATLDTTLAAGRTVFFYPPREQDDVLLFRKQMPGELHPNGRSFIAISSSGERLHANDATQLAAGMRATQAIYPLHAGKAGSETWRLVVFLMGLAPAFFFASGLWLWVLRRRRQRR